MSSRLYYTYTVRDRKTDEILFEGSGRKCAEFLGCSYQAIVKMAKRCWATEQGYFNSRYTVTRDAGKKMAPRLKYYKVYEGDKMVAEGFSHDCADALGLSRNLWFQLVTKCSYCDNPKYRIESELYSSMS